MWHRTLYLSKSHAWHRPWSLRYPACLTQNKRSEIFTVSSDTDSCPEIFKHEAQTARSEIFSTQHTELMVWDIQHHQHRTGCLRYSSIWHRPEIWDIQNMWHRLWVWDIHLRWHRTRGLRFSTCLTQISRSEIFSM